jgi:hypothetical protein|tara:strand:+ start:67 stop:693 length:627 start_codon:yes stop_codon:yes gene_type:complete
MNFPQLRAGLRTFWHKAWWIIVGLIGVLVDRLSSALFNAISDDKILSLTLYILGFAADLIAEFWSWLISDAKIPVAIVLLFSLSILANVIVLASWLYNQSKSSGFDWSDPKEVKKHYITDSWEDLTWIWRWNGNQFWIPPNPLCPKCNGEMTNSNTFRQMECINCNHKYSIPQKYKNSRDLERHAEAEMYRRVRTGEFIDIVKKQQSE